MRFETAGRVLFVAAALAAMPPPAGAASRVIWVEMCDAVHAGGKIPLPLDRDDRPAGSACHAGCGLLPGRDGKKRDQFRLG
jgi:hypothetical protein